MTIISRSLRPFLIAFFGGVLGALIGVFFFSLKISEPALAPAAVSEEVTPRVSEGVIADARQNLVYFFASAGAPFLNYKEATGVGFAATADGLIIAPVSLPARTAFFAATLGERVFSATPIRDARGNLIHDVAQSVTFFKAAAASASSSMPKLRSAALASFDRLRVGEEVFSFNKDGGVVFSRVSALTGNGQASAPISSEEGAGLIVLNEKVALGTLVFDQYGALLGVADKTGNLTPAELIAFAIRQYLTQNETRATRFGINFVDLGGIVGARADLPTSGLLLQSTKGQPAVLNASPAQKAGLLEGDVIISFDGRRFDGRLPFAILLSQYRPGVEVEVEVLRAGETKKMKVVLDAK